MTAYFSYFRNETFRPRRGLMGIYYLTGGFCAIAAFCQYRKFIQTNLDYVRSTGQPEAVVLSKYCLFTYL